MNTQHQGDPRQWRQRRALAGGGALSYRVHATDGWFGLDPAFSYDNLRMELARVRDGLDQRAQPVLPPNNQFAREIDHFARCVREDREPYTPGEEGLQDQRLMDAIYESARSGRPVKLERVSKPDAFRGPEPEGS